MRIGIDARLYNQTGVGRYLRNLIRELIDLDTVNEYVIYLRPQEYDLCTLPKKNWKKRMLSIPWHTIKEQVFLPSILLQDHLDIAHFPYFNVPIFYPKKYLLTIHDLIVDHFDTGRATQLPWVLYKIKRFGYKLSMTVGIRRASHIAVISKATRDETVDHYRVDRQKISLTYDALDPNFQTVLETYTPKKYWNTPYLLYVGNAYPHKNLERLINAFMLVQKTSYVHLVFAGDDLYFYPKLQQLVKKHNMQKYVRFFGNANDRELVDLYSFARLLIFPSLMEGFGLPTLEALSCGVLPVISNIHVFGELWEHDLPMFNPFDVNDMATSILRALSLPQKEYRRRVDAAKKRVRSFSWKDTAEKTLALYEKIYYGSAPILREQVNARMRRV